MREQMEQNALALEYQGDYGSASGNLDVSDLINNPGFNRKCRVFGLGLQEESLDLIGPKVRAFLDDSSDSLVVGHDAGQPFPK
jgi:hypothetical protein